MNTTAPSDSLVSKIKKLLSLASSSNQFEAEAAMAKAVSLATAANINISRISGNIREFKKSEIHSGQRLPVTFRFTSGITQFITNTKVVIAGSRDGGRYIHILGKESDVELAEYILDFLNNKFMSLWKSAQIKNKYPASSRENYLLGLYQSLLAKLKAEKAETERQKFEEIKKNEGESESNNAINKYSLSIIDNTKQLEKFVNGSYNSLKTTAAKKISLRDSRALENGREDGKNIQIRAGLNGGANKQFALN